MTDCREIQGGRTAGGYGRITRDGKRGYLHRWVWEQVNGPIPPGMQVLHRCDNPPCFRYDHLFLGTQADNMHDMFSKGRRPSPQQAHCRSGRHELTDDNLYVHPKDGKRECLACRYEREARHH